MASRAGLPVPPLGQPSGGLFAGGLFTGGLFARGLYNTVGWLASVGLVAAGCAPVEPSAELGQLGAAIEGGYVDEATTGVVGLGIQLSSGVHAGHCSGTLLAPNVVLTARHCVLAESLVTSGPVDCGRGDFMTTPPAEQFLVSPTAVWPGLQAGSEAFYGVSEIRLAPGADSICGYDVALLVLDRAIPASVALPIVPRVDEPVSVLEVFSAAGYGLTAPTAEWSGVRNRIDDKVVFCSQGGCDGLVEVEVTPREWVSADAGVCAGDSGGPALDPDGRVIGVISRGGGDQCSATVFADVAAWSSFIIDVAKEAAEEGGYPAPFWTDGSSVEGMPSANLVELESPEPLAEARPPTAPVDAGADEDEPACGPGEVCRPKSFGAEGCAVIDALPGAGGRGPWRWFSLGGIALAALLFRRSSGVSRSF